MMRDRLDRVESMLSAERFFDLTDVRFRDLFVWGDDVWGALARRDDYIQKHLRPNGQRVAQNGFHIGGDVQIGEGTIIEPGAYIKGPTIIGDHCQIRHGAYIRGHVIIGNHVVIGHTTEVNRSIILNHVRADHFAYIGDSVLGNKCHLGAGAILANVKVRVTASPVRVRINRACYETGMRKLGGILGDNSEIGCNTTLNPGTVLERNVTAYPGIVLRGYYSRGTVVKTSGAEPMALSGLVGESPEVTGVKPMVVSS